MNSDEKNDVGKEEPESLNNFDLNNLDLDNLDFNNLDFSKMGLGNFDFGNLLSMFNFPVSDNKTDTNEEQTVVEVDTTDILPDVVSELISSPHDEDIEDYLN